MHRKLKVEKNWSGQGLGGLGGCAGTVKPQVDWNGRASAQCKHNGRCKHRVCPFNPPFTGSFPVLDTTYQSVKKSLIMRR